MVRSGVSSPEANASSSIRCTGRSLSEPPGLVHSALAKTREPLSGHRRHVDAKEPGIADQGERRVALEHRSEVRGEHQALGLAQKNS